MGRDAANAQPSDEHFRRWLQGLGTGCLFAVKLAADARVNIYSNGPLFAKADLPAIDAFITSCAAQDEVAAVLFPHVRSVGGIARVIATLRAGDRWTVERIAWAAHPQRHAVPVTISWRNAEDLQCSVMGFGPLGCMPTTRRAPYYGLAVWGGGRANKQRRNVDPGIGFIDIRPGFDDDDDKAAHRKRLAEARDRVSGLLAAPPEDVEHLRNVAYVIPKRILGLVFPQ